MATASLPTAFPADQNLLLPPTSDGRVRFTRTAYRQMVESGALGQEPSVELVNGEILAMSPIGPLQGAMIRRLVRLFAKQLPDAIDCSVQLPIVAGVDSEPQPDIALVRQRDDDYQNEHPSPADVVLLVEVSQSSLTIDLGRKLQMYAGCGIPEYWVVNVDGKVIVVHREPTGTTYRNIQQFGPGDTIAPAAAPNCHIDLASLFR